MIVSFAFRACQCLTRPLSVVSCPLHVVAQSNAKEQNSRSFTQKQLTTDDGQRTALLFRPTAQFKRLSVERAGRARSSESAWIRQRVMSSW